MQKERLLISGRLNIYIFSMMAMCILICGCITNSATNDTQIKATAGASIPANVTPIPIAVSNESALPAPPVKNTSTATQMPLPTNKSTNVSQDFAAGLPPAVLFTHVPAYGSNETLKGTVTGVDPAKYRLAIFINSFGWWNVPSSDDRLTNISSDGTWQCNITRGGAGLKATEIDAFLVPAGFEPPRLMGRFGLPGDVRDNATAVNSVTRQPPAKK